MRQFAEASLQAPSLPCACTRFLACLHFEPLQVWEAAHLVLL